MLGATAPEGGNMKKVKYNFLETLGAIGEALTGPATEEEVVESKKPTPRSKKKVGSQPAAQEGGQEEEYLKEMESYYKSLEALQDLGAAFATGKVSGKLYYLLNEIFIKSPETLEELVQLADDRDCDKKVLQGFSISLPGQKPHLCTSQAEAMEFLTKTPGAHLELKTLAVKSKGGKVVEIRLATEKEKEAASL